MTEMFQVIELIYDKDGRAVDYYYRDVNPAFERLVGKTREQLVDKRVKDIFGVVEDYWLKVYDKVAMTGEPAHFENYGAELDKWYIIYAWKPNEKHVAITFTDITERKKAEEALRESERRLNRSQEIAHLGSWELDLQSNQLTWSDEVYRIFGLKPQQFGATYAAFLKAVHPDDRAVVDAAYSSSVREGKSGYEIEHRVVRPDGEVRTVHEKCDNIREDSGKIVRSIGMVQDITERKKVEERLEQSNKKINEILESIQDTFFVLDRNWNFVYVNKKMADSVGLKTKDIIGQNMWKLFPKYVGTVIEENYRVVMKDRKAILFETGGKYTSIWYFITVVPSAERITVIGTDITKRKKAEEKLAQSNQRITEVLESIQDNFYSLDSHWNFVYINKQAAALLGKNPMDLIGRNIWELFPKARATLFEKNYREAMDKREIKRFETPGTYADVWLMVTVFPSVDGISVWSTDISERKKAVEKLEDYQKNLEKLVEERTRKLALSSLYARNLIEASLDPLVTISAEGKITDVNRATEQVTGTSRAELIGSDFSDYFTEPVKAMIGYKRVFSEGFVTDYPLAIKHKSGKVTEVLYNATVYRNATGEIQGVFAAARDITERKKAEEQAQESAKKLKDSERLAAIGATAGMVGHDIRNPLQAIVGDLYLLEDDVNNIPDRNSKQSATETINSIAENIEYINKIVQDLQDYARPINPKIEITEIKPIIEKLLTKKSVPTNVNATVIVEDEAKKIQADSYYINRILYNLVTNAIQAMPKGGKLTIHAFKEANDVVITVKDTGVGIPKEIQDKMFTLMFTTKAKGQGFGLPVVKRMTESLGGTVSFESQAGEGTTFTVRLPPKELNGRWTYK